MDSRNEQETFSVRLHSALTECGLPTSPTKLSRIFNRHSPTQVSVGGARRWLRGESIPTQIKIVVLAELTGTFGAWLRFGSGPQYRASAEETLFHGCDPVLAAELALIPRKAFPLLKEFVDLLLDDQDARGAYS